MRYWLCRIAVVGYCHFFAFGSYIHRNSVPYKLLTQKIFSRSGTKDLFLQGVRKNLFLQEVKKMIFLVVMRVSLTSKNHKQHNIFHNKVTIVDDEGNRHQEKNKLDLI
jgi:hypothetical protein